MSKLNKNLIKFSFFLILFSAIATPITVLTVDSRCWEKSECEKAEGKFYGPNSETISACGGEKNVAKQELVFCKPPYTADTQVDFGGKNRFENIGEFIKHMYRYAIIIAGLLAVVIIIFSGFEWTTSGGNQEKIGTARKRIGGAMMGLIIASMSYVILNLVNPYLVNLRLPQVWMINPQGLAPIYCDSLTPTSTKVAVAFKQGEKISDVQKKELYQRAEYNVDAGIAECGAEYFVKDSGGQTCSGTGCPLKNICASAAVRGTPGPSSCIEGMLAGTVRGTFGIFQAPAIGSGDNIKLLALCKKEGKIEEVADINYSGDENGDPYRFLYDSKIETVCSSNGGVAGFYLGAEVNDETYGTDGIKFIEGHPLSFGTDDWHAVGQTSPKSHNCSVNLSIKYQGIVYGLKNCGPGNLLCTCAYISNPGIAFDASGKEEFLKSLITLDDLKRGYICNIEISRSNFPAADNTVTWPSWEELANYSMGGATVGAIVGASGAGVGAVPGAIVGAFGAPVAKVVAGFWRLIDDPTSCRDKN